MLQELAIISAKQLAISKQVYPLTPIRLGSFQIPSLPEIMISTAVAAVDAVHKIHKM